MTLKDNIEQNIKNAMKSGDKFLVSTLRMVKSAIANYEIELRSSKKELTEDDVLGVIIKEAKKRQDSIQAYEQGGRQDLADQEKKELEIIQQYLPAQLSEDEVRKIIQNTIESLGNVSLQDFGKIMGAIMPKLKGQADGNLVNQIVKEILAGK
ncbi:MAG: GatB/YqeY domain-containing protein [Patescibacteria group bacterium]|nr:GatB/YqeY domain-containing protein [Patescibacteria group bacterium]